MKKVKPHIEHRITYSFEQSNNPDNLFASCNICNHIKRDLIFDTDQQMRVYILTKRKQKEIEIIDIDEDGDY